MDAAIFRGRVEGRGEIPAEGPAAAPATSPATSLDAKTEAAQSVLRTVLALPSQDVCITSSFQAEDMVVVHMVTALLPDVPVLFLDTGYHFAETYEYRDRLTATWKLNLVNILPEQTVAAQESEFGILNQTAPDRCCALRKVGPLFKALADYDLWFTGLRRAQSRSRADLQAIDTFALPGGKLLQKISLLSDWTTRDVWQYAERHGIPLLPLYDRGYSSIGCEPCTSLPIDPNDPRSGRWSGQKLECGIHIQPAS